MDIFFSLFLNKYKFIAKNIIANIFTLISNHFKAKIYYNAPAEMTRKVFKIYTKN